MTYIDASSLQAGCTTTSRWNSTDAIIYALSVGCGSLDPTEELAFTTENSENIPQQVIPTFAVSIGTGGETLLRKVGVLESGSLLTREDIALDKAIPVTGEVTTSSTVRSVSTTRRGVLFTVESVTRDAISNAALFTRRWSSIAIGATSSVPPATSLVPLFDPSALGEPDEVMEYKVSESQALLYRVLTGRNPVHSDPAVAGRLGYSKPILQGRCTLGYACRAIIARVCRGDANALAQIGARMVRPVFPGDRLRVRVWQSRNEFRPFFDVLARDGERVLVDGTAEVRR
jgi:acyl dehydratase